MIELVHLLLENVGNTSSEVLHQASSDAPFIFNNVYYEDTKLTIKNNYMFIPVGDWNVYHKINKGSIRYVRNRPFNALKRVLR